MVRPCTVLGRHTRRGGVPHLPQREDLARGEGFEIRDDEAPTPKLGCVFFQALATNILNPKVALFFLALLPQFVGSGTGGGGPQLLVLGLTFALPGLAFLCAPACFSGAVGGRIPNSPAHANALRWLTGGVLVGSGVRLELSGRQ